MCGDASRRLQEGREREHRHRSDGDGHPRQHDDRGFYSGDYDDYDDYDRDHTDIRSVDVGQNDDDESATEILKCEGGEVGTLLRTTESAILETEITRS